MTYSQACWVCRDARFDSLVTLYAQLEAVISPGVHWFAAEAKLSGSIQIGVSKSTAAIIMLSILQPKHMPLLCDVQDSRSSAHRQFLLPAQMMTEQSRQLSVLPLVLHESLKECPGKVCLLQIATVEGRSQEMTARVPCNISYACSTCAWGSMNAGVVVLQALTQWYQTASLRQRPQLPRLLL